MIINEGLGLVGQNPWVSWFPSYSWTVLHSGAGPVGRHFDSSNVILTVILKRIFPVQKLCIFTC